MWESLRGPFKVLFWYLFCEETFKLLFQCHKILYKDYASIIETCNWEVSHLHQNTRGVMYLLGLFSLSIIEIAKGVLDTKVPAVPFRNVTRIKHRCILIINQTKRKEPGSFL